MTAPSRDEIRRCLIEEVSELLKSRNRIVDPAEISDDTDLLLAGFIDSLGLLELAAALSGLCEFELDFSELGPEELTVVGPLCDFVAAQAADRGP